MKRKSKVSKACDFSHKTKKEMIERDGGCIFCQMGYYLPQEQQYMFDAMHYIPRSKMGLGIVQNGAIGCRWHHEMMDQGSKSRRPEMLGMFKEYLKGIYPDWDEDKLRHDKWRDMFGK